MALTYKSGEEVQKGDLIQRVDIFNGPLGLVGYVGQGKFSNYVFIDWLNGKDDFLFGVDVKACILVRRNAKEWMTWI